MRKVALIVGVLAILAGAFSVLSLAPATSAEATQVPTQQFNMCGQDCPPPDGKTDLVNFLVTVSNPHPWQVTLNEVCSNEYVPIRDYLLTLGYVPDRYISQPAPAPCNQYGTAMFTLGVPGPNATIFELTPYNGEKRALLCRVSGTFIGSVVYCVTHVLTSGQVAEAFFYYDVGYASYSIRFIGGDFNKVPTDYAMGGWYGGNYEADTSNAPTWPLPNPSVKIDYLFSHILAYRSGTPICNIGSVSDHCYFAGQFYF